MRSQDHALHYSASRGKNSAHVVTHHSVLFIYLTLSFPLALAWTSRNWPRPHSPGLGLGLGLGLKLLASFNITIGEGHLASYPVRDGPVTALRISMASHLQIPRSYQLDLDIYGQQERSRSKVISFVRCTDRQTHNRLCAIPRDHI